MKKPSGAAFRSARRERDEQERRDELARRAGAAPGDRPDLDAYRTLGEPPADATKVAEWAAVVGARLLSEILADPVISASDRRRAASDLIGKIGQVSAKSALQGRVRQLEERLAREVLAPRQTAAAPSKAINAAPAPKPARALRAARKASK